MLPRIKFENGVYFVPSEMDRAFRKALLDGVPKTLHQKMKRALDASPRRGAAQEAKRHFGDEAQEIFAHAATFANDLHQFLANRFGLVGLLDWLTATGYGNDFRMIAVFAEWARLSDAMAKKQIILPSHVNDKIDG